MCTSAASSLGRILPLSSEAVLGRFQDSHVESGLGEEQTLLLTRPVLRTFMMAPR